MMWASPIYHFLVVKRGGKIVGRYHDCPFHAKEACYSDTCIHDCNGEGNESLMSYMEAQVRLKQGDTFVTT